MAGFEDVAGSAMLRKDRSTKLRISASRFDWHRLVFAHGWIHLAPFQYDQERGVLSRPLRLHNSGSVNGSVAPSSSDELIATIQNDVPLHPLDKPFLRKQIQRMLRLEEDFSDFHRLCKADEMLRFAARHRCGGLLRSPTAFEDVIKTVATTNCDWRNTKSM